MSAGMLMSPGHLRIVPPGAEVAVVPGAMANVP
jgi:hypothetical protein